MAADEKQMDDQKQNETQNQDVHIKWGNFFGGPSGEEEDASAVKTPLRINFKTRYPEATLEMQTMYNETLRLKCAFDSCGGPLSYIDTQFLDSKAAPELCAQLDLLDSFGSLLHSTIS